MGELFDLTGKVAVITGSSRGIGKAIAERMAEHGAKVTISSRKAGPCEEVAAEINAALGEDTAFAFPLDVTKEDQWIYALEEADAAMGGISVLVNNAGISRGGNIEQLSYEDWKLVMSVNVDSVFLGTKHALKYMRQNQPGSIINISSIAGLIAAHNSPAYNASKAGVWLLSKGIALHCAKQGLDIRSNSIHPTFIDTPILDPLRQQFGIEVAHGKLARQIPLGHIGEPGDIASAVIYLASDESKFMTGAELKLDGGISAM